MKNIILVLFLLSSFNVAAQELNCTVQLNFDQLNTQQTTTDKQSFADIQTAISEFVNNRRWTTDQFSPEERIKCTLNINLLRSPNQNVYIGTAQFIVQRPVFNTDYETAVLNYTDKNFSIDYRPEERQMLFNENSFSSNLTSTLAFYALIAVGLDYDSFSKLGGTPYLQRAFNVATMASNAGQGGWGIDDPRNKHFLAENLINQQYRTFREGLYNYYRLGLDKTTEEPQSSRKYASELLNSIKQIQNMQTSSILLTSFFEAKNKELYHIFSEAPTNEKQQTFTLLANLDPPRTEMYRELLK